MLTNIINRKDILLLRESTIFSIALVVILAVASACIDAVLVYSLLPLSNLFTTDKHSTVNLLSLTIPVLPFLALVIVLCFLSPLLRYLNLKSSSLFVARLSNRLFYKCHSNILAVFDKSNDNYSHYLSLLTSQLDQVSGSLLNIIYLFSNSLITATQILILVAVIDVHAHLLVLFVLGAYLLSYFFSRAKLVAASKTFDMGSKRRSSLLMDSFKLNFEFYLRKTLDSMLSLVSEQDLQIRLSQSQTIVLATLPRFIVEAIVTSIIVLFVLLNYMNSDSNNSFQILPVLSVLLISSQKIIPSLQSIYSSIATIKYAKQSVYSIYSLYSNKPRISGFVSPTDPSPLSTSLIMGIQLTGVTYQSACSLIFSDLNLYVPFNKLTRIIGPSGSGKSTLLKILTKQITPQEGEVEILTTHNQKSALNSCFDYNFAYCSQKCNLISSTVRSNITLTFDPPNSSLDQLIWNLLELTCLADIVYNLPDRLDTILTDDNPLLSGGEIQRLILTRALYSSPRILFVDETTNAMDPSIESIVLRNILSIQNLQSLVMIKHGEIDIPFHQTVVALETLPV